MAEERMPAVQQSRSRGMPGLTWAVILIAVGVIFLLNNLHITTVDWLALARYWPVILILLGLDVLIGRNSVFGSLAAAAVALVVIGGLVWFTSVVPGRVVLGGNTVTRDISQALGDAKTLTLDLNIGAAKTNLKALHGSQNAVEGKYTTNSEMQVDVSYNTSGDAGTVRIEQNGRGDARWMDNSFTGILDLGLTDGVPVAIDADMGVGEGTLDLTGIKLTSLKIDTGVGAVTVILPASGDLNVIVQTGVGAVTIRVPKALEGQITYDGGLSSLHAPDRFDKIDDRRWQTAGYGSAKDRVTMKVSAGIGSVDVSDYQ